MPNFEPPGPDYPVCRICGDDYFAIDPDDPLCAKHLTRRKKKRTSSPHSPVYQFNRGLKNHFLYTMLRRQTPLAKTRYDYLARGVYVAVQDVYSKVGYARRGIRIVIKAPQGSTANNVVIRLYQRSDTDKVVDRVIPKVQEYSKLREECQRRQGAQRLVQLNKQEALRLATKEKQRLLRSIGIEASLELDDKGDIASMQITSGAQKAYQALMQTRES